MKILCLGRNMDKYLAHCHEAFRLGLQRRFGAVSYGPEYEIYDPAIKTMDELVDHIGFKPDLIFIRKPIVEGVREFPAFKVGIGGDYWSANMQKMQDMEREYGLDLLMVYFRKGVRHYSYLSCPRIWIPACFDPEVFKDWGEPKKHDVGFLAFGTQITGRGFYPERYEMHRELLLQKSLKYFHAGHPGWRFHDQHEIVREGFSQAINRCHAFVVTGGFDFNPNAKYFEALASGAVVCAEIPDGERELGFEGGVNYLSIPRNPPKAVRMIRELLEDKPRLEKIRGNGLRLAAERHSCEQRAEDFVNAVRGMIK